MSLAFFEKIFYKAINTVKKLNPINFKPVELSEEVLNKKRKFNKDTLEQINLNSKKMCVSTTNINIIGDTNIISFDSNKMYKIEMCYQGTNHFLRCNCGVQYGCGYRSRCKHIRFIIGSLSTNLIIDKSNNTDKSNKQFKYNIENEMIDSLEMLSLEKDVRIIGNINLFLDNFRIINLKLMYSNDKQYYLECSSKDKYIQIESMIKKLVQYYIDSYTPKNNKCKKRQSKIDIKNILNM